MVVKQTTKKAVDKIKKDNENGARKGILEDLFYDFNRSRTQIYKMNFFRGIFFGLGSVLGGTIVVALLVWGLSLLVDLPGIGHSIQQVQQSIQSGKK
ncbi:MAG: DUF5665 domain-containing protein [Candidatus Saccharimonadales bacterium]